MDWWSNISMHGLPWWAILVLLLFIGACREGIPALLKYYGFGFEREKYRDGLKKQEHDALVDELKIRIEELAKEIEEVKREAKEERLTSAKLLADERAAHAKCQLDMAELRGDIRVMQEKIKRLENHDEANKQNVEKLEAAVKFHTEPNP